jgi:hypothetical protein
MTEGQTEERFVNDVIAPHLSNFNINTSSMCIPNVNGATSRRNKGGWNKYSTARVAIMNWWKQTGSEESWYSTMFDLYRIPEDFPGIAEAHQKNTQIEKVSFLEDKFKSDIIDNSFWHFIPYIQLHEFEALLFVEPSKLINQFPDCDVGVSSKLENILKNFNSPEHINKDMPPSKRIIELIPEYKYRKASVGPLAAGKIGLAKLRKACPHFGEWLTRLEGLAA